MIDIEAITRRLFDDREIRNRLVRDFALPGTPSDPKAFASTLLHQLGQTPIQDPRLAKLTNRDVFKAAVRALGSNSRSWATFLKHEDLLSRLLRGYDPKATSKAVEQGALRPEDLKPCLPGQSATADARAILLWARLLSETSDYYALLCDLANSFCRLSGETLHQPLADSDLLPCVAGYLGKPPAVWQGEKYLSSVSSGVPLTLRKTPGMSYVLASEFLRNLGWNGFKPDRHVIRLFDRWFPNGRGEVETKTLELVQLIGHKDKPLISYIAYSQLGAHVAPRGISLSHVDNLVWLLGAYVEKKGKESNQTYLK